MTDVYASGAMARATAADAERLLHLNHLGGHHATYRDLLVDIFDLEPSVGRVGRQNFLRLVGAREVFFVTLDDDVLGFFAVGLARAALGRRTGGIFLRPQSCFFPGFRATVKRWLFTALRGVPKISMLSLVPMEVRPEIGRVADGQLPDPQLWDLLHAPQIADAGAIETLKDLSAGRPLLSFIGTVSRAKGIDFLASVVQARPDFARSTCLVIAGKVLPESAAAVAALRAAGAIIWDRRISDAEIASLYTASNLVWACYHPLYDQASGIFGRALQFGKTPVIRKGASVLEHYVRTYGIDALSLPHDPAEAARMIADHVEKDPPARVETDQLHRWRDEFISLVRSSLGRVSG